MGTHGSLIIRPVQASEFAEWADLYRGYRDFYALKFDEAVIDRVWRWITDESHEVNALVAVAGQDLVGLAHYRRFARPSSGTEGLFLDDLYTAPGARGMGAGRALLAHISALAERDGRSVVRWITAEDNTRARALYDSTATATKWVTYDMVPETS
jgi:ribosomal protein S18 acetylase RimI-like enzyme